MADKDGSIALLHSVPSNLHLSQSEKSAATNGYVSCRHTLLQYILLLSGSKRTQEGRVRNDLAQNLLLCCHSVYVCLVTISAFAPHVLCL